MADEDYVSLAEEQLYGPGRFQDTLRIVVFRKNLSKSLRNPESKTLMLTLVAGGDFQLGIEEVNKMNDIISPENLVYKNVRLEVSARNPKATEPYMSTIN